MTLASIILNENSYSKSVSIARYKTIPSTDNSSLAAKHQQEVVLLSGVECPFPGRQFHQRLHPSLRTLHLATLKSNLEIQVLEHLKNT